MNNYSCYIVAFSIAAFGSVSKAAVEDPGSYRWRGIAITPHLKSDFGYDDNLFKEGADGNSLSNKGTPVFSVIPSVNFKAEKGFSYYSLSLDADKSVFLDQDDHDFVDYGLNVDLYHELNSRNRLQLTGGYRIGHEQGSTLDSANDKSAPEYKQKKIGAKYGFGAREAKARLEFAFDTDFKDYKRVAYLDRDAGEDQRVTTYTAMFYYNVLPKIDGVFELRKRNLDYSNVEQSGYSVVSYLLGLNWEATAKTSGYIKGGIRNRNSDAPGIESEIFNGWEIGIRYLLLEYSTILLSSGRDYGLESENPSDASFTRGALTSISWQHEWTSKISSNLGFSYTDNDIQYASGQTYKERVVKTFSTALNWNIRHNVTFSMSWEHSRRDEKAKQDGVSVSSYRRNLYLLSAEVAI